MKQQGTTGLYHQHSSLNYFYLHTLYLQHFSSLRRSSRCHMYSVAQTARWHSTVLIWKSDFCSASRGKPLSLHVVLRGVGKNSFPPSVSGADPDFPLQALTASVLATGGLFSQAVLRLPWNSRSTNPLQVPFPHLFLLWNSTAVKQVQKPLLGAHIKANEKALCSFTIPHPYEVQSRPWSCGNEDCQCPKLLACSHEICKP